MAKISLFIFFFIIGLQFNLTDFSALTTFAFSVSFVSLILLDRFKSNLGFAVFLFLATMFVHYRQDVYFYFDEWTLIDIFMNQGNEILNYRHNEHYLPLFFGSLFLETKLFRMHYELYILVSILIHTFNAFLIYAICQKINIQNSLSKLISALFVISPLHSEVLHWAFEQSLLACSALTLVSIYYALKYFETEKTVDLMKSIFPALLTPFVFGNGFSVVFVLFLFWLKESSIRKPKQLFALLTPICLCFMVFYLFYFTESNISKVHSLKDIFVYIFTGTQLGVSLRGLGLFPTLEIKEAPLYFVPDIFKFYPEFYYSLYGFAICLVLLLFSFKRRQIKIWALGFFLPVVLFILPALTRAQHGAAQALSLRYDYLGVLGLFLMLVPVFHFLNQSKRTKQILALSLVLMVFSQLKLAKNYRYFSDYGIIHRKYVEQLIHWKCNGGTLPTYPKTIYPGYKHDLMLESLDWFDKDICN